LAGSSYGGVAGQGPTIVINGGSINWGGAALSEVKSTVASGGTLKGTGTAGNTTVQSGGTVNVGNSPGCMTFTTLTLNSGSTLAEEIVNSTMCSGYDSITVTGVASINGATLQIIPSGNMNNGDVLTILSASLVNGTFSGLPDGSTVTAGGMLFRVNYTGTTVTLTKLSGTLGAPNTGIKQRSSMVQYMLASTGLLVLLMITFNHVRSRNTKLKSSRQ
jgi:hypothetical protein